MNLEKILEAVQVERHDFLNHLQVISGLLQLDKTERAREYIGRVSLEMAQKSKTAWVKIPDVTAVLLAAFNDAARHQIDLEITVNSGMTECAIPGPVVADALERSLICAFKTMSSPEIKQRHIEIIFTETEKKYSCRLLFPEPETAQADMFEEWVAPVSELLGPYGGRVSLLVAGSGIEIFLTFPRKETKTVKKIDR